MADSVSTPINPAEPGLEIRTSFVRGRNALVARATFTELYVDYYLHRSTHHLQYAEQLDAMFKRGLAGFVLHCASRPWNEMTAWTINFQDPLANLFFTGDNETGAITGRVFVDDIKVLPQNLFYTDIVRGRQPKRRSTVSFTGNDPLAAAETFFAQSEQRPARFFEIGEEDFVLVSEHPDCDDEWFAALNTDSVRTLDQEETLAPLERRIYRWHCGCNQQRMMEVIAPVMRSQGGEEDLFGDAETIQMPCPRCAARHTITREAMEAFIGKEKK